MNTNTQALREALEAIDKADEMLASGATREAHLLIATTGNILRLLSHPPAPEQADPNCRYCGGTGIDGDCAPDGSSMDVDCVCRAATTTAEPGLGGEAVQPSNAQKLYLAVSNLLVLIGKDGSVNSRSPAVAAVMDCLNDIDGGEFKDDLVWPGVAPQPQQAAPETIVFNNPSHEPWLREQAAPGAVLEGWMPIETAPKDAVHMDGANRYAQRILACRGDEEPLRCRWWFRDDSDACNFIADGGYAVFPTHWMPLPAAPSAPKPQGE